MQVPSRTLIRQIVKRTFLYPFRCCAVDVVIKSLLKMEQLIFPSEQQREKEKFLIFIVLLCAIQSFLFGRTTRTCYFHIHIHMKYALCAFQIRLFLVNHTFAIFAANGYGYGYWHVLWL